MRSKNDAYLTGQTGPILSRREMLNSPSETTFSQDLKNTKIFENFISDSQLFLYLMTFTFK